MKVQIITRKLITPSSPTPPHLQNLKLSCLDKVMPPLHIACVLAYPANGEDHAGRSKKLQKSLAETMTLFYPLGGRYDKENLSVDCNDEGVEYLEAQVSGCLSQLLDEGDQQDLDVRNHLVPNLLQPEDGPLVIVQCNMFECGGLAVGISGSHKIFDAFTMCTFLNAWSTACRIGIEKTNYCPSFSFCPPGDLPPLGASGQPEVGHHKKIVGKKFVFDAATISKLKAVVDAYGVDRPTRVEVVVALIWRTLIKVSQARHGYLRPSIIFLPFNMRGKTAIPTPDHLCGNSAIVTILQFTADDKRMQLHEFVNLIRDAKRTAAAECSKVSSTGDILLTFTNNGWKMNEALDKKDIDVFGLTSWCRFPFYEVEFSWGKPSKVIAVDPPHEGVLLMDTKDGDGIEASLVWDENTILLFQQNLDESANSIH